MLKAAVVVLVLSSAAQGAECHFASGDQTLYFVTPALVAVADNNYRPPYACYTSTLGTGVEGRKLSCSDGFEGTLVWETDDRIAFRDREWDEVCD